MRKALLVCLALILLVPVILYLYRRDILWFSHPDAGPRILDVSHHQGTIDWPAVRSAGYESVWIKATEGSDWTDPSFTDYRRGAEAAGLQWGAYHFLTFCSDAATQARHFLEVIGREAGGLPEAVDVELGGNCKRTPAPGALAPALQQFLDTVETQTGRPMVIYVIEDQLNQLAPIPDRPLWVRNLFQKPTVPGNIVYWQFHARGWITGISGPVDKSVRLE